MIGTLILVSLTLGSVPGDGSAAVQREPARLELRFDTRIDGRAPRDGRLHGGGAGGTNGPGKGTIQTAGQHPGSGSMGPPVGFNLPPEAGPGPENLKFYVIHIGGFGKGTQTGFWEEFMVYSPTPIQARPLLVIFHSWGVGWADGKENTGFFEEGIRRRWNVMCQLGASGVHVSSVPSQKNTETALNWVFDNFNVDKNRIYGVGFSMGGGAVANYAARHLDPKDHMFAAIVDHTGMMAHQDTYANALPGGFIQFVFDWWYGIPPDPWEMARTSLLEFDPLTLTVDTTNDMTRNLTHVPTKVTYPSNEPPTTAYLITQNQLFAQHLGWRGGTVNEEVVPYSGHSWEMLDEKAICSWLGNWTLRIPKNADTLADEDGTYFYFNVVQDVGGAFTPFSWSINENQNKVLVWKTQNLQRISVDIVGAGLVTNQTLRVVLEADDGLADECRVQGWPLQPSEVRRDGIVEPIGVNWTYDPVLKVLTILEWDPATHIWDIDP